MGSPPLLKVAMRGSGIEDMPFQANHIKHNLNEVT